MTIYEARKRARQAIVGGSSLSDIHEDGPEFAVVVGFVHDIEDGEIMSNSYYRNPTTGDIRCSVRVATGPHANVTYYSVYKWSTKTWTGIRYLGTLGRTAANALNLSKRKAAVALVGGTDLKPIHEDGIQAAVVWALCECETVEDGLSDRIYFESGVTGNVMAGVRVTSGAHDGIRIGSVYVNSNKTWTGVKRV